MKRDRRQPTSAQANDLTNDMSICIPSCKRSLPGKESRRSIGALVRPSELSTRAVGLVEYSSGFLGRLLPVGIGWGAGLPVFAVWALVREEASALSAPHTWQEGFLKKSLPLVDPGGWNR